MVTQIFKMLSLVSEVGAQIKNVDAQIAQPKFLISKKASKKKIKAQVGQEIESIKRNFFQKLNKAQIAETLKKNG